ncbi:MAG: hypothetical protein WKF75_00310 [Singulisphaera sp.]
MDLIFSQRPDLFRRGDGPRGGAATVRVAGRRRLADHRLLRPAAWRARPRSRWWRRSTGSSTVAARAAASAPPPPVPADEAAGPIVVSNVGLPGVVDRNPRPAPTSRRGSAPSLRGPARGPRPRRHAAALDVARADLAEGRYDGPPRHAGAGRRGRGVRGHVRALANLDPERAEAACAEAARRHPLSGELHYLRAVLLMVLGRDEEAAQAARGPSTSTGRWRSPTSPWGRSCAPGDRAGRAARFPQRPRPLRGAASRRAVPSPTASPPAASPTKPAFRCWWAPEESR